MPQDHDAAGNIIETFKADIAAFRDTYVSLISELESAVEVDSRNLRSFFQEQIGELMGHLGAGAANSCADDEAGAAINAVDEWVCDNISNDSSYDVPVTLWMHGIEHGVKLIHSKLAAAAA